MVGILLQVNPIYRPSTDKLLSNSLILQNMDYSKHTAAQPQTNMLGTIKMPKNLNEINKNLPKKKLYDM